MHYTPRVLEPTLREYLENFPVVGITGPRQSGKSTLLLHVLKDYTYVTFDDHQMVLTFSEDPAGFMKRYSNRVIFDEVQYVPEIFNYIKIAVDKDRKNYGKYVVTGSSQFSFIKGVSESLAGRIGLLTLLPFQYTEVPQKLSEKSIYSGSYPELVDREYKANQEWYTAYFSTYLMRDVRSLSNIGDIRDFSRFIQLLAANTSQTLNMAHYANDIGISVPTIKRWISILEASYIIFLLPPYYKNMGKRIIKSPKVYFYDTGLAAHLTGIETFEHYDKGPMAGRIFENYIVSEILKKEKHYNTNSDLYYLRTNNQLEIDLIIDRKRYKEIIEIKKTATFKLKMVETLRQFLTENDKALLLYRGKALPPIDGIEIMPYKTYLKEQK